MDATLILKLRKYGGGHIYKSRKPNDPGKPMFYRQKKTVHGSGVDLTTGKLSPHSWEEREAVVCGSFAHEVKGNLVPTIREMCEGDRGKLAVIDEEIAEINRRLAAYNQKREDLLAAAFKRATPISIEDVKAWEPKAVVANAS